MAEENLARQAELALERQGDYDSLFYEGQWHSAGSLAERAARFATGLSSLGVRPGDRLVVLMANCPEVLITYSAAWRAGAVVTPLLFLVSEDELRHALADSGAVGVVTTTEFLPKVAGALAGAPEVRFVIIPGVTADTPDSAAPGVPVLSFDAVASADPGAITDRSGSDLAALLYTGGTTGRSKGVVYSHRAIVLHSLNCLGVDSFGISMNDTVMPVASFNGRMSTMHSCATMPFSPAYRIG